MTVGNPNLGLSDSSQPSSVLKRTRACLNCGSTFEVNPCHAKAHRFCRPKCRAAHHRRVKRLKDPLSAESISLMVQIEWQRLEALAAEKRNL